MNEAERRLRRVSQMRSLIVAMRLGGRQAYAEGRLPHEPGLDHRSDARYWRKLAREKGIVLPDEEKPDGE